MNLPKMTDDDLVKLYQGVLESITVESLEDACAEAAHYQGKLRAISTREWLKCQREGMSAEVFGRLLILNGLSVLAAYRTHEKIRRESN